MAEQRLPWKESMIALQSRGIVLLPRDKWLEPSEIDTPDLGRPHQGLWLRHVRYEEIDFENLSLRRSLIEHCRFHGISFRNTDLTLSCLAAEFIDCNFSDALLTCAKLGGSSFFACQFVNAQLIGAEFRGMSLEHCNFTAANLTGARFDRAREDSLQLSDEQRRFMVDWRSPDDIGPDEPDQNK